MVVRLAGYDDDMPSVLIVEDDTPFRTNLALWLQRAGYAVADAADLAPALQLLRSRPFDVVVTDLCLPGGSGLDLLAMVEAECPGLQVVFLTGQGTLEVAVAALREGRAFDFLLKPLRDLSAFRGTIERAAVRSAERRSCLKAHNVDPEGLTERDLALLGLLGQGLDNQTIAERLRLSEKTIRNRLSALYDRLDVANRTQAVLVSREQGWI